MTAKSTASDYTSDRQRVQHAGVYINVVNSGRICSITVRQHGPDRHGRRHVGRPGAGHPRPAGRRRRRAARPPSTGLLIPTAWSSDRVATTLLCRPSPFARDVAGRRRWIASDDLPVKHAAAAAASNPPPPFVFAGRRLVVARSAPGRVTLNAGAFSTLWPRYGWAREPRAGRTRGVSGFRLVRLLRDYASCAAPSGREPKVRLGREAACFFGRRNALDLRSRKRQKAMSSTRA